MYLSAPGLVCSVGMGAEAACAAMRAGIAQFEDLSYCDNRGGLIVGAVVPGLNPKLKRAERLVELLALALADTLATPPDEPLETIPLIVCLAERDRPGDGLRSARDIVPAIESRLRANFHPEHSGAIVQGHVSGFAALRHARELMEAANVSMCLVCAVDSYINASALNWLNSHWRLKTEENSDGVIPGEAAAAVLIRNKPSANSKSPVCVAGLGFGTEPAAVMTEEPLRGLGLTEAVRDALAESGIQMHEIGFRLSDATGESYGFREQALMLARLLRARREEFPIWHCAENLGDTGAAAGIVQLIVAFYAFKKDYAPGDIAMCSTCADSGKRAVALLTSNPSTKLEA